MKYLVVACSLFFSFPLFAEEQIALAETRGSFVDKRIHSGDWSIGVFGQSFKEDMGMGSRRSEMNVDVQYFWWDHFSVGIIGKYTHTGSYDLSSLGLKGTYHFYESDRTTFYVSQDVSYNLMDVGGSSENFSALSATTSIGVNYFLTPNVTFGPRLEWAKYFGGDYPTTMKRNEELGVKLGFSVFF